MTHQIENALVLVEGVSKRYGRTLALDDVSLDVLPNELFALLGPNGAGKTTLVHILCTIQRPDSGRATVADMDVAREPVRARQRIGVVFQESSLDIRLTVFENLEFHGLIYGVPSSVRRQRIAQLLELVELTKWRDHLASSLSSGMKRRLEIARALIHDSRVLFLDEPTVGLDAQTRARIWEYIRRLQKERELTVVITTHYLDEVENSDRVCIIDHGRVLALQAPADLREAYGKELLRVRLSDESAEEEIRARYGERVSRQHDVLTVAAAGDEFIPRFLSEYGARLRSFEVETPSLEQVFLALTGREIRDQAAGARERTYEFGKRGGEHTR